MNIVVGHLAAWWIFVLVTAPSSFLVFGSSNDQDSGHCSQVQLLCNSNLIPRTQRFAGHLQLLSEGTNATNFLVTVHPGGVRICGSSNATVGQWYLAHGFTRNLKLDGSDLRFTLQVSTFRKVSTFRYGSLSTLGLVNRLLTWCLVGLPKYTPISRISAIDFESLQGISLNEFQPSAKFRKLMQAGKDDHTSAVNSLTGNEAMMPNVPSKRYWLKILVGVFVGGSIVLFLLVLFVTGFCLYKRKKRQTVFDVKGSSKPAPIYIAKTVLESQVIELKSVKVQQFSLLELSEATNAFNTRIGEGGFGAVYHGILPDGQAIAVKVRSANSIQGQREFKTELDLLSGVQHENLVPLIGFCPEQQILVYPYMSNGSLQDRLYGEASRRKPLDWITRLNIALGAARGLHFLHSSAGVRCIIHRDVKSSNILLDNSMVAKVADFGFSKYAPQEGDSMVSLEVRGTTGYLDPEYYSTQQLTVKSDVFSFGVVLLEIICGREPLNTHRPRPEWSLVEWAKSFVQESDIQAIVDPAISMSYTPEAMWRVVEIAIASVEPRGLHRPTMEDIVRELEDSLIIENNASQYMASMSIESLASVRLSVSDNAKPPPMPLFYQFDPSPVFSETMVEAPDPR